LEILNKARNSKGGKSEGRKTFDGGMFGYEELSLKRNVPQKLDELEDQGAGE